MTKKVHYSELRKPSMDEILDFVSLYLGVEESEILSSDRHKPLPEARAVFCYFANRHYDLYSTASFVNIDHSTVHINRQKILTLLGQKWERELIYVCSKISIKLYGHVNLPTQDEFNERGYYAQIEAQNKFIAARKLMRKTTDWDKYLKSNQPIEWNIIGIELQK